MSFSSALSVLPERCVWAEDAGPTWRLGDVCSFGGEAHNLALQLHSVQELHGEVAHIKTLQQ